MHALKDKCSNVVLYGGAFLIIFAICLLFPYSGDDWAWGSEIGLERLDAGFADYNGRYVGNLIVLILTRNIVLRSAVVSSTLVAIAYFGCKLAGSNNIGTFLAALLILMLLPPSMGAQAIVWVSGFTNYAIPALLILLYLHLSKQELLNQIKHPSIRRILGWFAIGIMNSLIMENVTLFNVAMALVATLFCRFRQGRWSVLQLSFLAGALIGAIVMFSNGAYWLVASGQDGYRSISGDLIEQLANRTTTVLVYSVVVDNWAISSAIIFILAYALLDLRGDASSPGTTKRFIAIVLAVFVSVESVSVYCVFIADGQPGEIRTAISTIAAALWLIALCVYGYHFRHETHAKTILVLVVCIVVLVAPLCIVNPIGPRNFFPVYCLELGIVCSLWDRYIDNANRALSLLLVMLLLATVVSWASIYVDVWKANNSRNSKIQSAADQGLVVVKVKPLPHAGYVHCPDPTEGIWESRYKLFYGIPEELDIELS